MWYTATATTTMIGEPTGFQSATRDAEPEECQNLGNLMILRQFTEEPSLVDIEKKKAYGWQVFGEIKESIGEFSILTIECQHELQEDEDTVFLWPALRQFPGPEPKRWLFKFPQPYGISVQEIDYVSTGLRNIQVLTEQIRQGRPPRFSSNAMKLFEQAEEEKENLRTQLLFSFEDESIEDGMHHPSEKILLEAIDQNPIVLNWIEIICSDDTNEPPFLADLLKCLGRINYEKVKSVAEKILERALAHTDIRVRDAAVYAIEHWGAGELVNVLKGYAAGEQKKWLRCYMEEVAGDISED